MSKLHIACNSRTLGAAVFAGVAVSLPDKNENFGQISCCFLKCDPYELYQFNTFHLFSSQTTQNKTIPAVWDTIKPEFPFHTRRCWLGSIGQVTASTGVGPLYPASQDVCFNSVASLVSWISANLRDHPEPVSTRTTELCSLSNLFLNMHFLKASSDFFHVLIIDS